MDNKANAQNKAMYSKLKDRYHNKIIKNKKKGLESKIVFFETERCLELWFLYHFQYTTRKFSSYSELERSLKTYIPSYEKSERFFIKARGLHRLITKDCKGNFTTALANSTKSVSSKLQDNRDYTYSEMSDFFKEITPSSQ